MSQTAVASDAESLVLRVHGRLAGHLRSENCDFCGEPVVIGDFEVLVGENLVVGSYQVGVCQGCADHWTRPGRG